MLFDFATLLRVRTPAYFIDGLGEMQKFCKTEGNIIIWFIFLKTGKYFNLSYWKI